MDKSEASTRRGRLFNNSNGGPMDRKGFRSLICDESGIIIGEMVYRCLICSYINESMDNVRNHYQSEHVDIDDSLNGDYRYLNGDHCPSPANSYADDPAPSGPVDDNEQEEGGHVTGLNGNSNGSKSRSGYITCRICSSTRFYSYVQRRYGQYTCSACYRHFREFLLKPKIFTCSSLGSCPLDAKNKCRACWLLACMNMFDGNIDDEKQKILTRYRPVKDSPGEDEDDDEDKELNNIDAEDVDEKESEDFEQAKDDESESELASIKPHGSIPDDDQEEQGTISGEEQASTPPSSTAVKRNLNNKVHKILKLKKVNSKRKRNWSCMKCANCLKQECGKCVYCLDRPKYGGQFRLRQRCAVRRCLPKLKDTIVC